MSFLPPVIARLLGDTRDYSSKLSAAGKQTETETDAMSSRFDRVKTAVADHAVGISAAVAGIGVGFAKLGATHKQAMDQLDRSIENTGAPVAKFEKQIDDTVKRMENFAHTDVDTARALATLTRLTHDPAKAIENMGLVADISADKHITLEKAATLVGQALNGSTKLYKLYGVAVTDTKKATTDAASAQKDAITTDKAAKGAKQDLLDLQARIADKLKLSVGEQQQLRDAEARVNGAANDKQRADAQQALDDIRARQVEKNNLSVADQQHLRDAEAKVKDTADEAAAAQGRLTDANKKLGDASKVAAGQLDQVAKRASGQAAAKVDNFNGKLEVWKVKLERVAATMGSKVGPALGVLATVVTIITPLIGTEFAAAIGEATLAALPWIAVIGAVVVAGYLLYKNWGTVTSFVKKTASEVFDFVKRNFDLIALAVTGPIAPLLILIHHWRDVKDAIVGVGTDIIRFIADKFLAAFEWITRGAAAAFGWVPGIGPKLKDAAKAVENFRDDVNASLGGIQDKKVVVAVELHNQSSVALPKDTPHAKGIPQYDVGGRVPGPVGAPQLAIVHGGEFVVSNDMQRAGGTSVPTTPPTPVGPPAAAPAGGGNTYVTAHVHFHNATVLGGNTRQLAEDMAPALRDELIRGGFRQQLGLPN